MNETLHNADNLGIWQRFQALASGALDAGVGALTAKIAPKQETVNNSQGNPGSAAPVVESTAKKWLPWAIGGGVVVVVLVVVGLIFKRN